MSTIKKLYGWFEQRAVWLLGVGVIVATILHLRLWLKDRRRLQQLEDAATNVYQPVQPPPLVTVLLPAWNEADNIDSCVQSLLDLRYSNLELIICAGGADGTIDRAKRYAGRKVIVLEQLPGEGKQRALRHCYQYANGEIIYLTDADCIVDDETFELTVGPLLSGQEHATTGAWRPLDRQLGLPFVRYQWAHHIYREVWMPDYAPALDGKNAAVRREVLDDVGSFEIEAQTGTDYILSKQLEAGGYHIRFTRHSHVQTEYPETARVYWKQASRWFRNPLILGWQWGDYSLVASVLRAGIMAVLLLIAPIVIVMTRSGALLTGWTISVIYLLVSAKRVIRMTQSVSNIKGISEFLLVPFIVIGWIGMARGLFESLRSDRRQEW